MSMLSEKRKKKKWSLNPNGKDWSNDDNKYGQRMLEKMGWEKGKGLGVNLQGMKEHVKLSAKNDTKGLGCSSTVDELAHHQENFQNLLSELQPSLNEGVSTPIPETSTVSLEEKSKNSRARVHYQKFTRGKDVSRYSDSDLAGIFGKKAEPKNNTFEVGAYEDDSIDSSGRGRHESASTNIVKEPFTSSPDLCQDSDSYDEFSSSDTDRSIVHFPRRRSRKKNVNTRREDTERGSQVQNSVKFPRVSVPEVVHVTEKIMSQENVFVNNHLYPCDQKQKSIELVDLTDDLESVVKVPNVMSKKAKDIAVPKNYEKNVLKTGVSSTEVPFAVKNSNCTVIGAEAYVSLTTEEIDKCLEDLNQKEKEGKDKDKKEKPVKVNLKRRVQLYDNQLEINNSCVESTSDADSIVSIHEVLNEKDKVPADKKQKIIVLKHIKLNLKVNTPVKIHKDFKIIVERYPVSHKPKPDNSLGGKAKDMAVPKNYEKNVLITGGSSTEIPFPVENSNPSVVGNEAYECLTAVAPNIHSDCVDNINDPDEPASNPKRKKLKRNCCESTALKGSVPLSTEPLPKHKIPKGNEDRVTKNAQKTPFSLAKRVLRSSVKSKMSMDKKSPNQEERAIKTAVQVNFKGSNIHLIPGYGCSQKSL